MAGTPRLRLPFSPYKLREIRGRKGLTQAELAQRCAALGLPVDRTIISRLERGVFGPTPERLAAIAQALGVEEDTLLAAKDDQAPKIMDKHTAAARLGVSVRYLEKLAAERRIPFTWRGARSYGWTEEQLQEIPKLLEVRPIRERAPATAKPRGRRRSSVA